MPPVEGLCSGWRTRCPRALLGRDASRREQNHTEKCEYVNETQTLQNFPRISHLDDLSPQTLCRIYLRELHQVQQSLWMRIPDIVKVTPKIEAPKRA